MKSFSLMIATGLLLSFNGIAAENTVSPEQPTRNLGLENPFIHDTDTASPKSSTEESGFVTTLAHAIEKNDLKLVKILYKSNHPQGLANHEKQEHLALAEANVAKWKEKSELPFYGFYRGTDLIALTCFTAFLISGALQLSDQRDHRQQGRDKFAWASVASAIGYMLRGGLDIYKAHTNDAGKAMEGYDKAKKILAYVMGLAVFPHLIGLPVKTA